MFLDNAIFEVPAVPDSQIIPGVSYEAGFDCPNEKEEVIIKFSWTFRISTKAYSRKLFVNVEIKRSVKQQ